MTPAPNSVFLPPRPIGGNSLTLRLGEQPNTTADSGSPVTELESGCIKRIKQDRLGTATHPLFVFAVAGNTSSQREVQREAGKQ